MKSPADAEDNLRVIRSLMERSTIYRMISAPAALFASLLAITVGLGLFQFVGKTEAASHWPVFVLTWAVIYVIADAFNFYLIRRGALKRSEPVFSSGMKHALRCVLPPFVTGFAMGVCFAALRNDPALCAIMWIGSYGLGLLATGSFAPTSISWLGTAFVLTSLTLLATYLGGCFTASPFSLGCLFMAAAFGSLNLFYALFVFASSRRSQA